jgi:two-component sensor histidine kinase
MDFILNQQSASEARMAKIEDVVARLANLTLQSREESEKRTRDFDERLTALTDSHIRLADAQARTEENIRNLTAVVDRHFSEGRNGKGGRK